MLESGQPATVEEALDCLFRALRRTSIEVEVKRIQAEIGRLEKSGDGKGVQDLLFKKQDLDQGVDDPGLTSQEEQDPDNSEER